MCCILYSLIHSTYVVLCFMLYVYSYAVLMDFPLVFRPALVARGKLPFVFDKVCTQQQYTIHKCTMLQQQPGHFHVEQVLLRMHSNHTTAAGRLLLYSLLVTCCSSTVDGTLLMLSAAAFNCVLLLLLLLVLQALPARFGVLPLHATDDRYAPLHCCILHVHCLLLHVLMAIVRANTSSVLYSVLTSSLCVGASSLQMLTATKRPLRSHVVHCYILHVRKCVSQLQSVSYTYHTTTVSRIYLYILIPAVLHLT
jgi:hypothetical protein